MRKPIAILLAACALSCSPQYLYLERSVVDKSDSTRLHIKKISRERLRPGMLAVGDTIITIRAGGKPSFR
jgi:hypothetical protein